MLIIFYHLDDFDDVEHLPYFGVEEVQDAQLVYLGRSERLLDHLLVCQSNSVNRAGSLTFLPFPVSDAIHHRRAPGSDHFQVP